MNIQEYIAKNKQSIREVLTLYLDQKKKDLININSLAVEAVQILSDFIQNGKFLRGSLVMLSTEMYGGSVTPETIKVAACLELMHSSILIHDDIMDNDSLRRGSPTVFMQYETQGESKGYKHKKSYGKNMAVCVGDIGFFAAYELLGTISINHETKSLITAYLSQELVKVGAAQLQDLEFTYSSLIPSESEILSMYKYKTGRYSFVLPMTIGAVLAAKKPQDLTELGEMGELLGTLFQIKDDEVGLFSTEDISGKSKASDIREGKKTLIYRYLVDGADDDQKKTLTELFGNKDITDEQLQQLSTIITSMQIKEKIVNVTKVLAQKTESIIKGLEVSTEYKAILIDLLHFNLQRNK